MHTIRRGEKDDIGHSQQVLSRLKKVLSFERVYT